MMTQRQLDEMAIIALGRVHVAISAFQENFLDERKSLVERAHPGAMRKPDEPGSPRAMPQGMEVQNARR